MKQHTHEKGFILVYALLIAGVILSATGTMYAIHVKELKLSSISREATIAYYAAEEGAECALYWFLHGAQFALGESINGLAPSGNPLTIPPTTLPVAECAGQQLAMTTWGPEDGFWYAGTPGDSQPCAWVTVSLNSGPLTSICPDCTQIRSRGFNTCITSAGQVERGYEIFY
jgi:hypothetical protein